MTLGPFYASTTSQFCTRKRVGAVYWISCFAHIHSARTHRAALCGLFNFLVSKYGSGNTGVQMITSTVPGYSSEMSPGHEGNLENPFIRAHLLSAATLSCNTTFWVVPVHSPRGRTSHHSERSCSVRIWDIGFPLALTVCKPSMIQTFPSWESQKLKLPPQWMAKASALSKHSRGCFCDVIDLFMFWSDYLMCFM